MAESSFMSNSNNWSFDNTFHFFFFGNSKFFSLLQREKSNLLGGIQSSEINSSTDSDLEIISYAMLPSFQQFGVKVHHSNEVVVCINFT